MYTFPEYGSSCDSVPLGGSGSLNVGTDESTANVGEIAGSLAGTQV